MKKILLISRFKCQRNTYNIFHFKGYLKGDKIERVLIKGGSFEVNEDYVISLTHVRIKGTTLFGELEKFKKIF